MSYSPSSPSQGLYCGRNARVLTVDVSLPGVNNGQVYHLKILVPAVAAGAIIGKGGETIGQLQKDTNARVKMSKANDFYPGSCTLNVLTVLPIFTLHF